jgi:hypothetical protein
MYPPNEQGNYGTITVLYIYYAYLNRMFRRTLTPKDGDSMSITFYTKNLLATMVKGPLRLGFLKLLL